MSSQMCFRWDNHASNICYDFQQMFSTNTLVDVTLVCEGKTLKAHKLILSACSSLFKSILTTHPSDHPTIILFGVTFTELKALVDFMYHGETGIDEENVAALIKCAENLKVRVIGEVNVANSEGQSDTTTESISSDEFEVQSDIASVRHSDNETEVESESVSADRSNNESKIPSGNVLADQTTEMTNTPSLPKMVIIKDQKYFQAYQKYYEAYSKDCIPVDPPCKQKFTCDLEPPARNVISPFQLNNTELADPNNQNLSSYMESTVPVQHNTGDDDICKCSNDGVSDVKLELDEPCHQGLSSCRKSPAVNVAFSFKFNNTDNIHELNEPSNQNLSTYVECPAANVGSPLISKDTENVRLPFKCSDTNNASEDTESVRLPLKCNDADNVTSKNTDNVTSKPQENVSIQEGLNENTMTSRVPTEGSSIEINKRNFSILDEDTPLSTIMAQNKLIHLPKQSLLKPKRRHQSNSDCPKKKKRKSRSKSYSKKFSNSTALIIRKHCGSYSSSPLKKRGKNISHRSRKKHQKSSYRIYSKELNPSSPDHLKKQNHHSSTTDCLKKRYRTYLNNSNKKHHQNNSVDCSEKELEYITDFSSNEKPQNNNVDCSEKKLECIADFSSSEKHHQSNNVDCLEKVLESIVDFLSNEKHHQNNNVDCSEKEIECIADFFSNEKNLQSNNVDCSEKEHECMIDFNSNLKHPQNNHVPCLEKEPECITGFSEKSQTKSLNHSNNSNQTTAIISKSLEFHNYCLSNSKRNKNSSNCSNKKHSSSLDNLEKSPKTVSDNSCKKQSNCFDHLKENFRTYSYDSRKKQRQTNQDILSSKQSNSSNYSKKYHQNSPDHLRDDVHPRSIGCLEELCETDPDNSINKQIQINKSDNHEEELLYISDLSEKKDNNSLNNSKDCHATPDNSSSKARNSLIDYSKVNHQDNFDNSRQKQYKTSPHIFKKKRSKSLSHLERHRQFSPDCLRKKDPLSRSIDHLDQSDLDQSIKIHNKSTSLDHHEEQHQNSPSSKECQNSADRSRKRHRSTGDSKKCFQNSSAHSQGRHQSSPKKNSQISSDLSIENYESFLERLALEQLKNSSANTHEKGYPTSSYNPTKKLYPTPILPIVLCERLQRVYEDDDASISVIATSKELPPIGFQKEAETSENEKQIEQENERLTEELESERPRDELGKKRQREEFQNGELQIEEMQKEKLQKAGESTDKTEMQKIIQKNHEIPTFVRQALYRIEYTQSGLRFYNCKQCSFTTLYLVSLKRHIVTKHEKLKLFDCDICSYAHSGKQNLESHTVELHEQMCQFRCGLCQYKCAQKSQLIKHMDCVHEQEKEKPYKCDKCDFRSSIKSCLKNHAIAVHEKRRDFTCDFCTYRSAQSGTLKRHMKCKHGEI